MVVEVAPALDRFGPNWCLRASGPNPLGAIVELTSAINGSKLDFGRIRVAILASFHLFDIDLVIFVSISAYR